MIGLSGFSESPALSGIPLGETKKSKTEPIALPWIEPVQTHGKEFTPP